MTDNDAHLDAKEVRRRVLMITKKSYWRQFRDGLLTGHSVKYLVHHTDFAIEENDCALNEFATYVQLVSFGSDVDKGTAKLAVTERLSKYQKKRMKLLNLLDSAPVILIILSVVFISCILSFTMNNTTRVYLLLENIMTIVFVAELCIRFCCTQDWQALAVDPYIIIDIVTVTLDLLLLSVSDLLGGFSDYSKSLRTIRFLRLIRLLRIAKLTKVAKKLREQAKISG